MLREETPKTITKSILIRVYEKFMITDLLISKSLVEFQAAI